MPATKGTFTKPISPTNTNTIAGLLYEPRAIILWTNSLTAGGFGTSALLSAGFSDGTNHRSVVAIDRDAVGAGTVHTYQRYQKTVALTITSITNSILASCTVAFVPSGPNWDVVFTWSPNDTTANIIHYLILGGADMRARVGSGVMSAVGTNNFTIGWGEGQPDALFVFSPALVNADSDSNHAIASGVSLGFGKGPASAPANGVSSVRCDNVESIADTKRYQRPTAIVTSLSATNNIDTEARLLTGTWPGDGFALDVTTFVLSRTVAYLALKNVDVAVGQDVARTAAGAQTTALPFSPEAIVLTSFCDTARTGVRPSARLSLGAASALTAEGGTWYGSTDAVSTVQADRHGDASNILNIVDNGTPTLNATANVTGLTAGFELTWSGTLGTLYEFNYIALREAGAAPGTVLPSLLSNAPVLPAPAHTRTISILPGLLSNAPSLSAPTLSATATVEPALLSNAPVLSTPTLVPGSISTLPAVLTNTPSLFSPGVTVAGPGEQTVQPPLLVNPPILSTPTLALTISILPVLLTNTPTIGTVVLVRVITIEPSLLANAPSLAAPAVEGALTVDVEVTLLLLNAPILNSPLVSVAGVTVTWTQYGEITRLVNPANHASSTLYYLEGTLWSGAEGNPAMLRLMYLVGATWTLVPGAPTLVSTVVSSEPPSITGVSARVRTASFTLPAGANEYRFEKQKLGGTVHWYAGADIRGAG